MKTCSGRFSWVAASNTRVAPPPPSLLSRGVPGNCLSSVGCGVPCDGQTYGDLAGGEVADAENSPRVVRVDAEHDALGPAWRYLVLGFGSPWPSPSIALSLAAFTAPSYQRDGGPWFRGSQFLDIGSGKRASCGRNEVELWQRLGRRVSACRTPL